MYLLMLKRQDFFDIFFKVRRVVKIKFMALSRSAESSRWAKDVIWLELWVAKISTTLILFSVLDLAMLCCRHVNSMYHYSIIFIGIHDVSKSNQSIRQPDMPNTNYENIFHN